MSTAVVPAMREEVAQLLVALSRVRRWLARLGMGEAAPIGASGVSALARIVREGPLRLGDLATRERIAPATLSRVVTGLVEHGYVVRSTDPDDARAGLLTATDAGAALVSGLRSERAEQLTARLARLAPEDRAALLAAGPALARLVADEGPRPPRPS
jgi:DNA-binding MarR family transcriptional regulator